MEAQFLQAVKSQDLKKLRDVLTISNGNVPINKFYSDLDGMSPLQYISYLGNGDILNVLLQQVPFIKPF
jgi:hypothetical protein